MRKLSLPPSVFKYKSSLKKDTTIFMSFYCSRCGCTSCYRHKIDYKLTFFEGAFICINCRNLANYYTDDWVSSEDITEQRQLSLFG